MLNSLDLMIIVVMVLGAAALLGTVLMFLVRNKIVQRVCLCTVATLSVYIGTVGFRINWPGFPFQAGLALALAMTGIGAVVLHFVKKDSRALSILSRLTAAGALLLGMINAFCV